MERRDRYINLSRIDQLAVVPTRTSVKDFLLLLFKFFIL
jgi:hypothetical protein